MILVSIGLLFFFLFFYKSHFKYREIHSKVSVDNLWHKKVLCHWIGFVETEAPPICPKKIIYGKILNNFKKSGINQKMVNNKFLNSFGANNPSCGAHKHSCGAHKPSRGAQKPYLHTSNRLAWSILVKYVSSCFIFFCQIALESIIKWADSIQKPSNCNSIYIFKV